VARPHDPRVALLVGVAVLIRGVDRERRRHPMLPAVVDPNRMNATKTGLYRDTLAGTGGPMTVTTNGRWVYNRDGVLYSQSQGVGGPVIWYP